MTGSELIAAERQRQIDVEGWTPEHDDLHDDCELERAACAYAIYASHRVRHGRHNGVCPINWPNTWDHKWWKPDVDPIRNLVKAGALIAAEIDRLQRLTLTSGDA